MLENARNVCAKEVCLVSVSMAELLNNGHIWELPFRPL